MARAVSARSVRRIIVLSDDGPITIHEKKGKKRKKQSSWLKPFEKVERRVLKAASREADTLRDRHDRSNRKRRDGWIEDMPKNMLRAERKGEKALKLKRI